MSSVSPQKSERCNSRYSVTPLQTLSSSTRSPQPSARSSGPQPRPCPSVVPRAFKSYQLRVIIGPPGCGKTHELLNRLSDEIGRGVGAERIAFVTFTKAAKREAVRRVGQQFGLGEADLPWFRTIHSAAYRLLGLEPDNVMSALHWSEFADSHGYELSKVPQNAVDLDGPHRGFVGATGGDLLRAAVDYASNCLIGLRQAAALTGPLGVSPESVIRFDERLRRYQYENGLLDFGQMLRRVLDLGLRPPVDVAFIDEAQDLSPLQIAVVEQWFAPSQRVYVAGDDDQAIYGFQGASPRWLRGLAEQGPTEILSQSYRVPQQVHGLAERIVRRNRDRVDKAYLPRDAAGRVLTMGLDEVLPRVTGEVETFVLSRNRLHLGQFAKGLVERAVPFIVEGSGARSPLGDRDLVLAVEAAHRLARGLPIGRKALKAVLDRHSKAAAAIPTDDLPKLSWVTPEDVAVLGLDALLQPSANPLEALDLVRKEERRYLAALVDEDGKLPRPNVVLTSIHGAKGRQADRVVLLHGMTRATHDEYRDGGQKGYEAENRVAYVGATRAVEELILVEPRGRRRYDFPRLGGLR